MTDYDPADRRIVAVQMAPEWSEHPQWRFVGDRDHGGRLVHRRAKAKHFPNPASAARYVEFLFIDNPHIQAWRIQTVDGTTVDQVTRSEWESELT